MEMSQIVPIELIQTEIKRLYMATKMMTTLDSNCR